MPDFSLGYDSGAEAVQLVLRGFADRVGRFSFAVLALRSLRVGIGTCGDLNPTAQTLNPQTSCSLKDRYCGVCFPAECSCAAKTARLHLRSRNPSPEQQYCFSWLHEFGRSSGEAKCKCPRRALRPNTPSMHSKPQH